MIRHVAVIDIGKTNAKVAMVDLEHMREIDVRTRPNLVLQDGPYPHFDIGALWEFILESLAEINLKQPVDAISATTHGATAALLDAQGNLALPVLDYEHPGPDTLAAEYSAARPPFEETGSPRLPGGLNLGAQISWMARTFPDAFSRVASIITYPQYWAYRLSGVLATEVTSLGCHTDLWNPGARDFSSLVDSQGWRKLLAPVQPAYRELGPLLPEIALKTGIAPGTPVFCGIHDSNASLLPHLISREPPFAVVSTGTWVVSMATGGKALPLDPTRDTLTNVNAFGDPMPSARFMGGREFETIMNGRDTFWRQHDLEDVVNGGIMLLPAVQPDSGPFAGSTSRWIPIEPASDAQRTVAASFYLSLMTATCLDLVGADGPTIVEGPLAANTPFVRMLEVATRRPIVVDNAAFTGTSLGAALLAAPQKKPFVPSSSSDFTAPDTWTRYAKLWKSAVEGVAG